MSALILASGSPRRRELMARLGYRFEVQSADIDETPRPGEEATALALRLAAEKARAVLEQRGAGAAPLLVIGADTIVVLDGEALGKPRDRADALATLQRLVGRSHEVVTAYAVIASSGQEVLRSVHTRVHFTTPPLPWLEGYVATGECDDKAGSYAIQGAGGVLVARIEGSHSNVIGLPLAELAADLAALGGVVPFSAPEARSGQDGG